MDTDPKKVVVKKPSGKSPIVINPPEKTLTGGHNEAFQISLQKNISICETKTKIILQAKAAKFDIPEEVVYKVFVRGQRAFPASASITREQYAMDHVNSFINGGAAMEKEWDLIPTQIDERLHTRMGTKGTGGAGRAHIKREKSPYNGKMIYHVVDRRGVIKHSTQDEMQAKRHLASKYRAYMESTSDQSPLVIDEARASAAVKLSQAWDQRKQSSEASRARAAAAKAEFEKQWQEKQNKPKQGVAEAKDPREYDYEGDMAKSQLRSIIANAQSVHDMLEDNTNIAEWVQSKITLAADYVSTVADYMQSEVSEEVNPKPKLINMLHLKMQRKLKITDND